MDAEDLSVRVLAAISAVESWMSSNRLRLNADKTPFIWFGTRQQLAKRDLASLASISPSLISSDSVRDLGVRLDCELTMDAYIKQLCRSCFYQLRRLRVIRHCLSRGSLSTLACAFICNRIDYCNGVLCGVTAGRLDRLQSVLNATARLVLNIPKFSHTSLAIRDELHWLPVQCRSQYKICILVRNSICRFVATLSTGTLPPCRLRVGSSASSICWPKLPLIVPQFRTVNYGLRGFSISGPRLWNTLPWHSTIRWKLVPFQK